MLDDDVARDLALFAGLVWEDSDRELLGPLIDATIVWAEEAQLDEIAAPIVDALWADGLRHEVERALDDLAGRGSALVANVPAARADLALGPLRSRLALAYVKQGAVDLAADAMLPGNCLCCFDELLGRAPADKQRQLALDAAAAIVTVGDADFGADEPTGEELAAARERITRIAALAAQSLPALSIALRDLETEAVWRTARVEQRAAIAAWN